MKTLNNKLLAEKEAQVAALNKAADALQAAVDTYNAEVLEAQEPVDKAIEAYNVAVASAKVFIEQITADQQTYFDDHSERWQESEAGLAYSAWMDEWANECLEEVAIEFPDDIEAPALGEADQLDGLSNEAEAIS